MDVDELGNEGKKKDKFKKNLGIHLEEKNKI